MWFNGWESVGRIVLFAVAAYALVLALIRVLGKRMISNMNASDFVITVAVGSIVASWIMPLRVSFVDGLVAATTLLGLQVVTEFLTTRSRLLHVTIDGLPTLLAYRGHLLRDNMMIENVSDDEVFEAMREHGVDRLADVKAVVLEVDGEFSVIRS